MPPNLPKEYCEMVYKHDPIVYVFNLHVTEESHKHNVEQKKTDTQKSTY